MTSDTHGATSYTERVRRVTTSPTTANVPANPTVTAVATTKARTTVARSCSMPRKNDR